MIRRQQRGLVRVGVHWIERPESARGAGEGPLTEPKAAVQPVRRERVKVPRSGRLSQRSGPASMFGMP
jgi:hypothetical protein